MDSYRIQRLSAAFYHAYPADKYPEIPRKNERPYTCLTIAHRDYFICIPFRSNMTHKQGFLFSETKRSSKSPSGLDYTKIVIIKEDNYIDGGEVTVDSDEYTMTIKNIGKIIKEATDYVDTYIDHAAGRHILHPAAYKRKYAYSTLPYFHDILGITKEKEAQAAIMPSTAETIVSAPTDAEGPIL